MTICDMMDGDLQPVSLVDAKVRGRGFVPFDAVGRFGGANAGGPHDPMHDETDENATDEYGRGFSEGYAAAKAEGEKERRNLLSLLQACEALQPEANEELSLLISETVEKIVTRILGEQLDKPEWLAAMIDNAVAIVAEADQARILRLNPDYAALLKDTPLPLDIMADDQLTRGSIRIDCSSGWIESGRSTYLHQLRTALGRREGDQ